MAACATAVADMGHHHEDIWHDIWHGQEYESLHEHWDECKEQLTLLEDRLNNVDANDSE